VDIPTQSEAIFAFSAWLTTRKESFMVGGDNEVPPMPQLADDFCKSQGFIPPRDNYTDFLKDYPTEGCHACGTTDNNNHGTECWADETI